jgi:hypothetical protein
MARKRKTRKRKIPKLNKDKVDEMLALGRVLRKL